MCISVWHSDDNSILLHTHLWGVGCVCCLVPSHRSCSPELDCQVGMSLWSLKRSPYVNIRSDFCSPTSLNNGCLPSLPSQVVPLAQPRTTVQQLWSAGAQQMLQTDEKCKKKKTKLFSLHLTHNRFLPNTSGVLERGVGVGGMFCLSTLPCKSIDFSALVASDNVPHKSLNWVAAGNKLLWRLSLEELGFECQGWPRFTAPLVSHLCTPLKAVTSTESILQIHEL